jgi:hypothetical protein
MPETSGTKKNYRITKMRVHEVSLAAFPKNNLEFILKKEGGIGMPSAIGKLLAFLAVKSADVAEIVKEELKKDAPKEITAKDLMEAAKELGIKMEVEVPEGSIIAKKEDVIDRTKFDVVEKGSWLPNESDPYKGLTPAMKERVIALEKETAILKEKDVQNTLAASVGMELAKEMTKFYMTLSEKDQSFLVATISGLQTAVKELGAARGVKTSDNPNAITQSQMEAEAQKIAKDENIPVSDAMIKWAERNPEKAANLVEG